ncbi:Zn-dependent exopeptidase [Abortiporus biennis]|nr:Zn-dependent exopeptidase [Abortiporus biennis]
MPDTKRQVQSEKVSDSIPLPAVTPSTTSRSRFRRLLAAVVVGGFFFTVLNRWSNGITRDVETEVEKYIDNPFSYFQPGHGHHRPRRPILNGPRARKLFLDVPNEESALKASRQYATKPHLAGSEGDFQTAKDFLALLQTELGVVAPESEPIYPAGTEASRNATLSIPTLKAPQAWIDIYYPVMNTPLHHSLELLDDGGNTVWKAELEEVADDTDPEAGKYFDSVPAWHGLSRGGEVKGKLVYANYGRREDYQDLVDKGVSLNGTIVLVRYGGIFRGLKVKGAQELGAAGILIFSDPRDDGTVTEANGYLPYPQGPARNANSVQRGSVQYLSIYPGDPTTPGYPSYENSTRTEGSNIPGIPSLPLSWANAKVLLQEIENGAVGRTVSLVNQVDDRVIPIWNTMGVIPGHITDEVVVVGNHRDAWVINVMGATDPSSGTASIHEVIRGLGALLKKGWKPIRTIYGLIGSTEWGEDFADFIDQHVVAYLNLDSSVSGSHFGAGASPSLAHLVRNAAESVPHPTKEGKTLWDARKDTGVLFGENVDEEVFQMYQAELQNVDSVGVSPLGSGSDFTVFLQRIGVASANGGFGSTLHDPVYHYHSVFDSQRWQEIYGDPGFHRHVGVAVAKHLGLLTLGIADTVILPLNTTHYSLELEAYLDKVESIAASSSLDVDLSGLRESIKDLQSASAKLDHAKVKALSDLRKLLKKVIRHRIIRHRARRAVCSIKKIFGKKCVCPHMKAVQEAHVPTFKTTDGHVFKPRIGRYPAWLKEQQDLQHQSEHPHPPHFPVKKFLKLFKRIRKVNQKLVAFERGLIHKDGIKDREWYRHLGVAPGKWLGYGATTFPALTESLTIDHNTTLTKYEAGRLEELISKLAKEIKP